MEGDRMETFYKLLIADDDAIIRRGLSQLIDWEKHHFHIVAYAADGEKAWEIIEQNPIDIVVSDIKMPFMDGIQLLEKICEKYPDIRVILLTGYEDFEYARQAIKYKAFDYLLKPMDGQQLLETVQRAAYSLKENRKIQKDISENLEMKRKSFYCKLLQGSYTSQELYRLASILEVPLILNGFSLTMSVYLDFYTSEEELREERFLEKRNQVIQVIEECNQSMMELNKEPIYIVIADYKRNQIEILITAEPEQVEEWKQGLVSYAGHIIGAVTRYCDTTVTIGMGNVQRELAGLHNSYVISSKAIQSRHLYGKARVIDGADVMEPHDSITEITLPSDRLLQHIRLGFLEDVAKDVEHIFTDLLCIGYISLESAKMIATELAIVCFKGQTMSGEGAVSYLYFLNEIQRMTTVEELKQKILELALQITEQRGNRKTTQRQLAEDALQYIQEHFFEESLSLGKLAGQFHVSQTYMGIVLKQETEVNFSTHLLNMRMQKSMELLRCSDVKHYEVAEQVGYSNPQYFAVCFKKYTGMTPTQFKEQ